MDEGRRTQKNVKSLAKNIKAMQAEITMLKSEVTRSDNSNSLAGSHRSDLVSGIPPGANKRKTTSEGDDFEPVTDDEEEEDEDDENGKPETQQNLYKLSEEATAFIETAFVSKLDNATRKARATKFGLPESRWLRCPKLDPVVSSTVLSGTRRADRAASRLQQFWLDAVNPLVYVIESAEEI